MIKTKDFSKQILYISIFCLISIVIWLIYDAFNTLNKSTNPVVLKEKIESINPNFDTKTLNSLKVRKYLSEDQIKSMPELIQFQVKEASPVSKKPQR